MKHTKEYVECGDDARLSGTEIEENRSKLLRKDSRYFQYFYIFKIALNEDAGI